MRKLRFFVFLVFVVLSSCGYRTATHSSLVDNIKTVYVEMPKNSSSNHYISKYLQKAIIDELKAHNIVIAKQKSHAYGIIETHITHYSVDPSFYSKNGLPIIYRCIITVNLTLKDKYGKELILNKTLTSFEDFKANDTQDANEIANSSIAQKVLNRLAVLIREDLFINF